MASEPCPERATWVPLLACPAVGIATEEGTAGQASSGTRSRLTPGIYKRLSPPRFVLLASVLVALGCCGAAYSAEPAAPTPSAAKDVFFLIPHTHWEGAVFETREKYLELGLPNILRALRLLKTYPSYRFVLDQACYVQPFLERYPEEEAAFRQFVQEGRLALVGGTDVMCDVNMPGGESYVRQVLYGKDFFRRKLGVDVTIGWQLDTFGHHAQMPQLLKLGGYHSFWFFRGVADQKTPSEFLWEGIDGSRIPAFWLPEGYALTYGSPTSMPAFAEFFQSGFNKLAPFARGRGRVGLAGADVVAPEDHVPALVDAFNRQPNAPFELRLAVPGDFEALVAKRPDRPVVSGELNPIFQGAYSSRIELKQRTRELERLLTTAEKLGVLLQWRGAAVDHDLLWRAWEPMLFNQAHDLMSGVMLEPVYEDAIRDYDFSKRIADDEVHARLRRLTAGIDSQGEGIPVVVFNPLGWARSDVTVVNVGFSENHVLDLRLVDPDGKTVPVQLVNAERNADGGLLRAEIAFIARDVPALGHAVYRLFPAPSSAASAVEVSEEPVLENDAYRLEFDPAGGAITHLRVKADNWEALQGPGNVVARQEDRGDFWELYHTLDASSRIAMKGEHGVPEPGKALFSSEQPDQRGTVRRGPVFAEFEVAHPFGKEGKFATTVRIYAGLPRIDIRTRIVNDERFVRYRVLFPTTIRDGQSVTRFPSAPSIGPRESNFQPRIGLTIATAIRASHC